MRSLMIGMMLFSGIVFSNVDACIEKCFDKFEAKFEACLEAEKFCLRNPRQTEICYEISANCVATIQEEKIVCLDDCQFELK